MFSFSRCLLVHSYHGAYCLCAYFNLRCLLIVPESALLALSVDQS